ncbi:MAG: ATP-binding cassette domain-containing protein [Candidatus Eisenbacteria bacterium]|nr:ATP-binding cassette domain-containing protein [Candidatus Latescibacterota bacterium]MBD3302885.1 ATP-binding cassette domain-containing protein [Candidatus Eisenbacteria bacterium]
MIDVENLSKSFGATRAVDGISFQVQPGEIYGLLGPNGAGKTTTISCITGLLKPSAGRAVVDGVDVGSDPIRARRSLGVVPQETAIYDTLSARENLSYFASLHGISGEEKRRRVDEALDRVGLASNAKQASKKFSGGMKRRLNLAIGLVSRPKALLLDEPTVGIDPQARIHILDVVREVQKEGTAVLYTTHYLEEAETLCDRVGIMDHGRILAEGTISELRARVGEGTVLTLKGRFNPEQIQDAIRAESDARIVSLEENLAMVATSGEAAGASELLSRLLRADLDVAEIAMKEPSLENLFIKLTGRELRD